MYMTDFHYLILGNVYCSKVLSIPLLLSVIAEMRNPCLDNRVSAGQTELSAYGYSIVACLIPDLISSWSRAGEMFISDFQVCWTAIGGFSSKDGAACLYL